MKKQKAENNSGGQVEKLQEQLEELTFDLQRTRADFENFRKQVDAQKQQERKKARYATAMKMLPLLDDIERAIVNYQELQPLQKTLDKTLGELGLVRIDSREGVDFNPDLHEAVMVEGEGEKEVIGETLRLGYYYEGEVLRPTMVKVRKF